MEQQVLQTTEHRPFVPATAAADSAQTLAAVPRRLHISEAQRRTLLIAFDTLLLIAGILLVWAMARSAPVIVDETDIAWRSTDLLNWAWLGLLLGAWLVFGALTDLYDVRTAQRRTLTLGRMAIVAVLSLFVTHVVAYLLDVRLAPRLPWMSLAGGFVLVLAWRMVYTTWARSPAFSSRTVILGTGPKAQLVASLLRQERGLRYTLLGQIAQQPMSEHETPEGLPILPISTSLYDLARDLQVDKIVVASDAELTPALIGDLIACQTFGIRVCSVSDLYDQLYTKIPVENVDAAWLLEALLSSSHSHRHFAKRVLDLSISLFALPWFLLVFPLLALAIKLDSPGPVFYRQVRTGLGGKPFEILKFRTMYTNAEQDGRARWAKKDDPRITRLGRFLRKSRLDEIPQFINILRGDMSLIGPRPERPEFIEQLEKEIPNYSFRLLVPPGLTGWAQIKYSYGNSIEDARIKLEYDTYYVRHWSLWMDIYILFQTVSVVLRAKGT